MASVPNMRTNRLIGNNTALASKAGDLERILCSANPSFQTAFVNLDMGRDVHDQVETLEQSLGSDNQTPSVHFGK